MQIECRVGVHTNYVELQLPPLEYAAVRAEVAVGAGRPSWVLNIVGNQVDLRSTRFGTAAVRDDVGKHRCPRGWYRIKQELPTVVRCRTHGVTARFVGRSLVIDMPAAHLWPFPVSSSSGLSRLRRRRAAIEELNARARSALEHNVDTPAIPDWMAELITTDEHMRHQCCEEI
jgi:hypothetical protein